MSTKMEITGLAQETDFSNPGITHTVLVINNGELRVPILPDAVEQVIKYAVMKNYQQGTGEVDTGEQAEPSEDDPEDASEQETDTFDESGIAQI